MKLSKAIARMQEILDEHGDVEFVYCDMDTDWAFKIYTDNITFYKGACEIYMHERYQSEEHHYN